MNVDVHDRNARCPTLAATLSYTRMRTIATAADGVDPHRGVPPGGAAVLMPSIGLSHRKYG